MIDRDGRRGSGWRPRRPSGGQVRRPPAGPRTATAADLRRWIALGLLVALGAVALAGLVRTGLYVLYPFPYRATVEAQAARAGLDPLLVLAVIRNESRFKPDSVSSRGARGLMQVEPATGAWIAAQHGADFSPDRLYDPAVNIAYGTWYLGVLQREFSGRTPAALAAYNAGLGRVRAWLRGGVWSGGAGDLSRIPYPETRHFVARVLRDWHVYRLLYER